MSTLGSFTLPPYFLYGIGSAFGGTVAIFYGSKNFLIPRLTSLKERFDKLSSKDQNMFLSTFPSMAHAIVQSFWVPAKLALGYSALHNANRVTHFDPGAPAYCSGVFVGYLLADFALLGPKDLGLMYTVHHVSAMAIWTWSASSGAMQWYASALQFCELSTIPLNLRQWILTSGYDSGSPLAVGVSLAFMASFFVVRVLPLPVLLWQWVNGDYTKLASETTTALALASTASLVIHACLQSFWFSLMVRKLLKMIKGGSKKDDDKGKKAD